MKKGTLQMLLVGLLPLLLAPQFAYAHGELLIRIAAASREIAAKPTAEAYLNRGELYRQDENWDAAEGDYDQAAKLGMKADAVDLCRAQLEADRNRLDSAEAILDHIIFRSPQDGKAFLARARIFVRQRARGSAISDFDRAFRLDSELDGSSCLEWAQTLTTENRAEEALIVVDRGIAKNGFDTALQAYAVEVELGLKDTNAALARLETIIDHADRKEQWLARRGNIQLAAGNAGEARRTYEAALGAIRTLPKILQRSPAMVELKSKIEAAMGRIGGLRD